MNGRLSLKSRLSRLRPSAPEHTARSGVGEDREAEPKRDGAEAGRYVSRPIHAYIQREAGEPRALIMFAAPKKISVATVNATEGDFRLE
jgi:hypothetical protein